MSTADSLLELVRGRTSDEGHAWLGELVRALSHGERTDGLPGAFSSAARRLGRDRLVAELASTVPALDSQCGRVPLAQWSVDVAGRVALLTALAHGSPGSLETSVELVYRAGDAREKIAVVRSLAFLPDGARFLPIALDAGRVNDTELFGAVAMDNPFAAVHFPELEFDKLVMKAAFVGARIDRIIGVERRANRELARMAMEHIDEQESARRTFAPEIWLAIAPTPPPGAIGRMLGYLSHAVTAQRFGAARGLVIAADVRSRPFIAERLEVEREEAVREVLLAALVAIDSR